MGLYDSVSGFSMKCPYCGELFSISAQTKDLGEGMFTYCILPEDWETNKLNKKFREGLQVFPQFPLDKESKWIDQAERREAEATVPDEYKTLKYIRVTGECNSISCQFDADRRDILQQGCTSGFGRIFDGKIKIKEGKLVGNIYDIKKDDLTEKKLSKYKEKDKKLFDSLIKKYKHEPIAVRHWRKGK
jgi:hypothetical protein